MLAEVSARVAASQDTWIEVLASVADESSIENVPTLSGLALNAASSLHSKGIVLREDATAHFVPASPFTELRCRLGSPACSHLARRRSDIRHLGQLDLLS